MLGLSTEGPTGPIGKGKTWAHINSRGSGNRPPSPGAEGPKNCRNRSLIVGEKIVVDVVGPKLIGRAPIPKPTVPPPNPAEKSPLLNISPDIPTANGPLPTSDCTRVPVVVFTPVVGVPVSPKLPVKPTPPNPPVILGDRTSCQVAQLHRIGGLGENNLSILDANWRLKCLIGQIAFF